MDPVAAGPLPLVDPRRSRHPRRLRLTVDACIVRRGWCRPARSRQRHRFVTRQRRPAVHPFTTEQERPAWLVCCRCPVEVGHPTLSGPSRVVPLVRVSEDVGDVPAEFRFIAPRRRDQLVELQSDDGVRCPLRHRGDIREEPVRGLSELRPHGDHRWQPRSERLSSGGPGHDDIGEARALVFTSCKRCEEPVSVRCKPGFGNEPHPQERQEPLHFPLTGDRVQVDLAGADSRVVSRRRRRSGQHVQRHGVPHEPTLSTGRTWPSPPQTNSSTSPGTGADTPLSR